MIERLIVALNSVNTPLLAVFVIVLGGTYGLLCNHYGMNGDGPSAIIGAGIGLLTGQALSKTTTHTQEGHPSSVQQTTGAPTVAEPFPIQK